MKVNKKTDLAIRILKYLIENETDDFTSGNTISQQLNISYNHLRRIVPVLNEVGFTVSKHGKDGGIKLTSNATTISIEQLLLKTEITEGCINDCETCVFNRTCTFEKHSKQAALLFCSYFKEIYLQDL